MSLVATPFYMGSMSLNRCNIWACCWGFYPAQFLQPVSPKENHTEVYISYKLIGPLAQASCELI